MLKTAVSIILLLSITLFASAQSEDWTIEEFGPTIVPLGHSMPFS